MHDIRAIRENPQAFDEALRRRGLDALSAELIGLDDARKAATSAAQANQERRNALAKEIGGAKKAKDEARAAELMAEVARLKEEGPTLEAAQAEAGRILRRPTRGDPEPSEPGCARGRRRARQCRAPRLLRKRYQARHRPPAFRTR